MCAVFHASANSNQRLEVERILGLSTPGVYENPIFESIKPQLPYETLAKFSLYHEIGHCLDPLFLPNTYNGGEDPHSVHESESFAEVMGLFLLTQKGYTNIARTRGLLRTIYSRKLGRFFTQNPRYGFGNPFYLAGGVIYYLEPALRGADEVIKAQRGHFNQLSLAELIEAAIKVVHENALDSRSFHAILSFLTEVDPQTALNRYREYSYNSPDLFYRAYSDLVVYSDYTDYILSKVFNPEALELAGPQMLSPIDIRELCTLSLTAQSEALDERLSDYRLELQSGFGTAAEQRERALLLNGLFENELNDCQSWIQ